MELSKLDDKMKELGSDIEKFNHYVKSKRAAMTAPGKKSTNLLIYLFKGYLPAGDESFVGYIQKQRDDYYKGNNLTEDQLMEFAIKRYMTNKATSGWCKPSETQKTVMDLQAVWNKQNVGTQGNSNKKNNKKKKKEQSNAGEWAWKNVPPKPSEPKTRKYKGKQYHWCPHHEMWTLHKPEGCRKNPNHKDPYKHKLLQQEPGQL